MKISIDATGLSQYKTGTVTYLTEIFKVWKNCQSIDDEYFIITSAKAMPNFINLNLDNRFKFIISPSQRHVRVFWQQLIMPFILYFLKIDIHWGAGFVLPIFSRKKMIVTIYDLTFQKFPMVHEKIKRIYFPLMIGIAVRKASIILVISESVRNDLIELYPSALGKTHVTLLAPRASLLDIHTKSNKNYNQDRYVLFIGTIEPRKNLNRLIQAWISLSEYERGGIKLIIVGAVGWMVQSLFKESISKYNIFFLGHVEDSELADLLRNATIFVYPSLYEGFGLPVVEAMAFGIPVLTSNVGATQEIARGAALLIEPESIQSIRDGLSSLLLDKSLRKSLSIAGLKRASEFCWKQTARKTFSCIKMVSNLNLQ